MTPPLIERRIRWAGRLICSGLVILYISLLSNHPLSFMAFLTLGCPLVLAGALLYLYSLAGKESSGKANLLLILIVALPLFAGGCASSADKLLDAPKESSKAATPAAPLFDPSKATGHVFGGIALDGKAPEAPSVRIGGDPYCQENAKDIFKQGSLVTEDGRLRNVIVYVRSGYATQTYPVPEAAAVLDQQRCVYVPHVLTVMKGQKLRILNSDPTFHNVHAEDGGRTEFNIPQASKGTEDTKTFSHTAMPVRIGCDFHRWMSSYVAVFDHPFHTTSGDSGKYELRVPPGKYEIVAWHEKYGEQAATIDVAADASVELNFKFPQKSQS